MAQFMFIKPNTKFKIIEHHRPFMYMAFLFCLVGLVLSVVIGPNWGTSFQGGTSISIQFQKPVPAEQVRKIFVDDPRFESVTVQSVGTEDENKYVVRTRTTTTMTCEKLSVVKSAFNGKLQEATSNTSLTFDEGTWPSCDGDGIRGDFDLAFRNDKNEIVTDLSTEQLAKAMHDAGFTDAQVVYNENRKQYTFRSPGVQGEVVELLNTTFGDAFDEAKGLESVSTVGADVGEKFRNDAIISIVLALFMMLLYIALRFDSRYAPAAVISLTATTLLTFTFIVCLRLEITLETVAAMLSLIGYGINDTIVNFDRIRENIALHAKETPLDAVINLSLNECLSRTFITSITTLLAILPLVFLANGTTRDFAIIMSFGICVATLNSIIISAPLVIRFDKLFKEYKKRAEAKKAIEEDLVVEAAP